MRSLGRVFVTIVVLSASFLGACTQVHDKEPLSAAESLKRMHALAFLFQPKAELGNAEAQFILGLVYFRLASLGETDQVARSVTWLRRAAAQDHVWGQTLLAGIYLSGKGIPRRYVESTRWAARAASQGHPWAKGILGKIVFLGLGMPRDRVRGFAWLVLADSDIRSVPPMLPSVLLQAMSPDAQQSMIDGMRAIGRSIIRFREQTRARMTSTEVEAATRLARGDGAVEKLLLELPVRYNEDGQQVYLPSPAHFDRPGGA